MAAIRSTGRFRQSWMMLDPGTSPDTDGVKKVKTVTGYSVPHILLEDEYERGSPAGC